jgi:esterase
VSFILHHELVHAETPRRWLMVLHGVFGSGANWRLFMRSIARQAPTWGFVLVDQRGHGASQEPPAPHGIETMAEDLVRLEASLDFPVAGVAGHSLGGKVALAYAEKRADALEQVWILDSQPGARDESKASPTEEVLLMLEALPKTFADRKAFTSAVEATGQSRPIAAWLAMNVRRADDGSYYLRLDLPAVRQILADYFVADLWHEVSRVDARRELNIVVAGKSFVWRDGDRARLEAIAGDNPRVFAHVIEHASHWLHVDGADALRDLMVSRLSASG